MLGNKLIVGVVCHGAEGPSPVLTDDRLEVVTYPSLAPWLERPSDDTRNGRLGGHTTAPPLTDCLMIVGDAGEVHRQQLVAQIADNHRGLPIVVIAPSPSLGLAVGIMRQGAYAVADASDPQQTLNSAAQTAASEGRLSSDRRLHLLDLRNRFTQLTGPERQVLDAMLDGKANKQIAQALQIGLRTVELRRSKIMQKMGARSLAELIKFICQVLPAETAEPPAKAEPQFESV